MNPFRRDKSDHSDLQLFVTFDSKAKTYDHPVFVKSKEVLMRDIINLMNDPKNQMAPRVLNAEDFSLFHIGSYSFETGIITTLNHEHVVNFHDLRAMSNWQAPKYEVQNKPVESIRALNPT